MRTLLLVLVVVACSMMGHAQEKTLVLAAKAWTEAGAEWGRAAPDPRTRVLVFNFEDASLGKSDIPAFRFDAKSDSPFRAGILAKLPGLRTPFALDLSENKVT